MKKDTSWGNVAEWYDKVVYAEDSYQVCVILPNLMRIVSPGKGMRILDIACGQGFFSHAFAAAGARVTGADISPELVEIARVRAGHNEEFHVAPADHLDMLSSGTYDAATIVLALQNIERMTDTLREAARLVKKGGKLVIALNHPAFRIPAHSAWGFDEASGARYRRVDEYLSESRKDIDMNPGGVSGEKTVSFHRSIQAYSKSLANAGFAISRIEEWTSHKESEKGPHKAAEDKARREIPLFMCLECVKL
ncbi:MAG: class I SAM-dependent methyltransferase [Candidatus Paceibacterota bacterium]|jgi:ubiquinone/menaquinone biosynthesis C-methylase UbiE